MQVGIKVNASIRRTERFEIYPAFKDASAGPWSLWMCKGLVARRETVGNE